MKLFGRTLPHTQLFCIVLAALTLLGTTLRILALLLHFDADIGYYQSGAVLPLILCIFWVFTAAGSAISFLINKGTLATPHDGKPNPVYSLPCAVMLLLCTAFLFIRGNALPAPAPLCIVAGLLALLGIFYFIAQLLHMDTQTRVLFGYALILALTCLLAVTYFDNYTPMNAPHKLSQHMALLAAVLAILFECRTSLGRALPRVQLCVTGFAACCCAVVSLSNTVAFFAGVYTSVLYLILDLTLLAFSVRFALTCLQFTQLTPVAINNEEDAAA